MKFMLLQAIFNHWAFPNKYNASNHATFGIENLRDQVMCCHCFHQIEVDLMSAINGFFRCMESAFVLLALFLVVKLLQVNLLDGYNRTALHYAAEKCASCVSVLLEYGADVNKRDGDGRSPLHYAAWKNKSVCAIGLLEAGADPDASDSRLDTPLSYAASKGHTETVKILLDFNSNAEIWNVEGRSALCQAIQNILESAVPNFASLSLLLSACGNLSKYNYRYFWLRQRTPEPRMVDLSSNNGILNGYNFDNKIFIIPAAIVVSVVGLAAYRLYMMVQGKQVRTLKKKNNDKRKK